MMNIIIHLKKVQLVNTIESGQDAALFSSGTAVNMIGTHGITIKYTYKYVIRSAKSNYRSQ